VLEGAEDIKGISKKSIKLERAKEVMKGFEESMKTELCVLYFRGPS